MLAHIGVNVQDLQRAKAYYDRLMPVLGFEPHLSAADQFAYRPMDGRLIPAIFFYPALQESTYSRHCTGLQHLAFLVPSRAVVHAVHTLVQELGSTIIQPPQEFLQYRPGYYAVFWHDPEGFMLEAVHRPDLQGKV
jgi:catechol 2,3-dioxygenase-like lactoylglutathione lyase family enzyme